MTMTRRTSRFLNAAAGWWTLLFLLSGTTVGQQNVAKVDAANKFTQPQQMIALNNVRFADQFPGTDAGQKLAAAMADLPPEGGVVDARGLSGAQVIGSTLAITKPVTILW